MTRRRHGRVEFLPANAAGLWAETARLLFNPQARYRLGSGGWTMPVAYRPARAEKIERAQELVVRSINDLTERHGFRPIASLRPPQFQFFCFTYDPSRLLVAYHSPQML